MGEPVPLSLEHSLAHGSIVHERGEHFRRELEVLGREQDAGPAQRFRHRPRGVGEDRHVGRHGLDEGHAEALVLAERDVGVCPTIKRREIFVGNRSGEPEAIRQHLEFPH